MITREQWEERQSQWAEWRRFEATLPLPEYSPEDAVASVGTILEWLPPSVRAEERDPKRLGVQRMHRLLGLLHPE